MRPILVFATATVAPPLLVLFAKATAAMIDANTVDTTRAANSLIQRFMETS
jgi:hypothetical protein